MTETVPWYGATRTWTLETAAASLPLVRRIVDDLVEGYRRWRAAVDAFEYATSGTRADSPDPAADALMAAAQGCAADIDALRAELGRLDIRVLRVDEGVVEFHGLDGASLYWSPAMPVPSYDWPESVSSYWTPISWPSRAQLVAGKRSRA